ncbi:mite allergen Der p 3-like [Phymastichus coffea]|uniref:mite allergen Der p 3-like n=1 Tax=Phymastichus coffea TaxID=108790 RepID=UPI00273AD34A|nr:mite allergen Der p 3-like [Phymastichus coffea]XP_058799271.1 mite allergen Der p 3-like [Phymastichus coffea]
MSILPSVISVLTFLVQNERMSSVEAIVGGSTAAWNQFPFAASFQNISKNNEHFCGGTLIHPNFILTAAHCFAGKDIKNIRVVVGVANLKSKITDKYIRKIAKVFINPYYNKPLPRNNDIAIIKLNSPYQLDKDIKKAVLASVPYSGYYNLTAHIVGWGVQKTECRIPSSRLRKAKVKLLERSKCVRLYENIVKVNDKVLCTFHSNKKNTGICKGDSGGSVIRHKNILIGVISANYLKAKCGDQHYPDLHTEVSKFKIWILSTIYGIKHRFNG